MSAKSINPLNADHLAAIKQVIQHDGPVTEYLAKLKSLGLDVSGHEEQWKTIVDFCHSCKRQFFPNES